jgi:hypothetical protein
LYTLSFFPIIFKKFLIKEYDYVTMIFYNRKKYYWLISFTEASDRDDSESEDGDL